jgi:hypothetical protein
LSQECSAGIIQKDVIENIEDCIGRCTRSDEGEDEDVASFLVEVNIGHINRVYHEITH